MNKFCIFLSLSILSLSIFSCKTQKNDLKYFEDLDDQISGILATQPYTNKIEPENELIITVKSEVMAATTEFNLPYTNTASSGTLSTTANPQLQTYTVDDKGNIDFPVLGKLHVAGMTIYELKDYLIKRISEYVKDPIVTVDMLSYRISVIGEVGSPRTITTRADRYNLLDCLADCGGLTEYAERDILIMRRTPDNQIEYQRLDLHDSSITNSPYFWLKNNDVVIVSPNSIKQQNSKLNQYHTYKLGIISSVIGMASVVASIIALSVK